MFTIYPTDSGTNGVDGAPLVDIDPDVLANSTVFNFVPEEYTYEMIARLIIQSPTYQKAHKMFSADTKYGKEYLAYLEIIPYSHTIADRSYWDKVSNNFGANSAFDKALVDAYNSAMKAILELVGQYQSFISQLAVNQVDQLRDAGINASVTGQGVTPGSKDLSGISPEPTSATTYNNQQVIEGMSAFVNFVASVASLATGGISTAVSSKSILGMLDLAEQEGYNKQEVHDMLMASLGVTTGSPYRVLNSSNTPVIDDVSSNVQNEANFTRLQSDAVQNAISSDYELPFGIKKSGLEVMHDMALYGFTDMWAKQANEAMKSQIDLNFGQIRQTLENENAISSSQAQSYQDQAVIAESSFNRDSYNARNGSVEGANTTKLSSLVLQQQRLENLLKETQLWYENVKKYQIIDWSEKMTTDPSKASMYYNALFSFGFDDYFHNQDTLHQNVHYGLDVLDQGVNIIGTTLGFFKGWNNNGKASDKSYLKDKINKDGISLANKLRMANLALRLL